MEINKAEWMTLGDQIKYMFSLSTVVIILSTSVAFYPTMKPLLAPIIKPVIALYELVAGSNSASDKRLFKDIMERTEKRVDSIRTPPDLRKEQENIGDLRLTDRRRGRHEAGDSLV
ncbi:uncharacterized protein PG998_012767 [Apiospora kogelbergensis]|uniref:uncharacterized protein n=1 Tax=Apiospora kogelbergensis TaxID=1337665 RepID=UPI003131B8D3